MLALVFLSVCMDSCACACFSHCLYGLLCFRLCFSVFVWTGLCLRFSAFVWTLVLAFVFLSVCMDSCACACVSLRLYGLLSVVPAILSCIDSCTALVFLSVCMDSVVLAPAFLSVCIDSCACVSQETRK